MPWTPCPKCGAPRQLMTNWKGITVLVCSQNLNHSRRDPEETPTTAV